MLLERIDLRGRVHQFNAVLPQLPTRDEGVEAEVRSIICQVRDGGDGALRTLTERFDGARLNELRVAPATVRGAPDRIAPGLRRALEVAHERITAYHSHALSPPPDFFDGEVRVQHLWRPVDRAGCYVPGGRARYPSTVLMCAVPARVAGVAEVVLCVPPRPDGTVDDATLAAAAIAGVEEVFAIGGAQAIAAMAFGTESVRRVDVVAGPGNRYVAEAMRQVCGWVGVPAAYAGPSEVVVVAGPRTPVELAAIDLVVQAEHGPGGRAWLISWEPKLIDEVQERVARLVEDSPRRPELEATLSTGGYACVVDGVEEAIALANAIAPEHLELLFDDARDFLPLVRAAGAVFVGPWSPASLGDYLAGTNHVLPTAGSARYASALRVEDFRRHIHAVEADRRALRVLGDHVVEIASAEGLPAHAESIRCRLRGDD